MKKSLLLAIPAVLCLGGLVGLSRRSQSPSEPLLPHASQATHAAYSDGLFLGSFAARRGEDFHAAEGRWARDEDRQAFVDGYRVGYDAVLAERTVQPADAR